MIRQRMGKDKDSEDNAFFKAFKKPEQDLIILNILPYLEACS